MLGSIWLWGIVTGSGSVATNLYVVSSLTTIVVVASSSLARTGGGGGFGDLLPACAFSFLSGVQFAHTNSTFLGQGQSTMAQRAETNVAERFLTSCVWGLFPNRFPRYIPWRQYMTTLTRWATAFQSHSTIRRCHARRPYTRTKTRWATANRLLCSQIATETWWHGLVQLHQAAMLCSACRGIKAAGLYRLTLGWLSRSLPPLD